MAASRLTTL